MQKRFKEKDPVRYAYCTLKNNAKRRGKKFTITLSYFRQFTTKTNYMVGKGITKESWHIDRKDETKGYVVGNLKVITNSENVKKYITYQHDAKGKPTDFKVRKFQAVIEQDDEYPF